MLKNIIGDWGSELDDADYACALAALGTLAGLASHGHLANADDPRTLAAALADEFASGERTIIWWRGFKPIEGNAAVLAEAWKQYVARIDYARHRPRFAILPDWRESPDRIDHESLCRWLEHPATKATTMLFDWPWRDDRAPTWHWPLRVGVPADEEHAGVLAALRQAQAKSSWVGFLSRCFPLGAGRDACDVLILAPGAARRLLEDPRARIRASFIVCLDELPSSGTRVSPHYRALRRRLQAAGVALVGAISDVPDQLASWFRAMLQEVSHDVPIQAAVTLASNRDSLVLGDPHALDRCRILAIAERQDRVISALGLGTSAAEPTAALESFTPRSLGPQRGLADALRQRAFESERIDGMLVVDDIEAQAQRIDQGRAPRWIQANVWKDERRTPARALVPRQWNVLAVHIGPASERRADAPFPDSQVDFSRGDVAVTVQVEVAGAAIRPLDRTEPIVETESDSAGLASSELVLPPAGDSTSALFRVFPRAHAKRVTGRIAVIHNNRILQTARVSVGVSAADDAGEGLAVSAEAAVHMADDLDERRPYDVAILVSDVGGKLHLNIQQDRATAKPVQLNDLQQPVEAIRRALDRIARERVYAKPMLEQEVFAESMYTLAAAGSELEQHLRKKCGDGIDRWERIHILPRTNQFLPLEYVYDGPPPKVGAAVCPNLLGALEGGGCEYALKPAADSACPNRQDKAFVCPMQFWGFRRLIERNGMIDDEAPSASASPVAVPSRQPYGQPQGTLFAAADRAFTYVNDLSLQKDERKLLADALRVLCSDFWDAADWDRWREEATKQPNLLVLVPHAEERLSTPMLEIGTGQWLGRAEIRADLSGARGRPQLLILLGCSAAAVKEDFQPYPQRFRDAGVSIVLAPVAPILGADAVPIAKHLAELLAQRFADPVSTAFGDLLPLLRRRLLRDGHPAVMGIVGFGDGDWLIGGE